MTVESTRSTMTAYFELLSRQEAGSRYYADDVTWHMVDSADVIRGASAVAAYVATLRSRVFTRHHHFTMAVADDQAFLEGHGVNATHDAPGFSYCLVYDVQDGKITAIRCYGSVAALMTV
jgi:ketosteroid isomerase-like protein